MRGSMRWILLVCGMGLIGQSGADSMTQLAVDPATQAWVTHAYGGLPLSFEVNRGQADARVEFLAGAQAMACILRRGKRC